jgi:hypothetical protein
MPSCAAFTTIAAFAALDFVVLDIEAIAPALPSR